MKRQPQSAWWREFSGLPKKKFWKRVHAAWAELEHIRNDIRRKEKETYAIWKETGRRGIVLAGRPYHIDPEIHHGIPDMINSYGIAVLTGRLCLIWHHWSVRSCQ